MTQHALKDSPVAIVTGGARGIGKAIASRLIEDGFRVLIVDLHDSQSVAAGFGVQAAGLDVDVSQPQQVEGMVSHALATFGRLDALVNNAGIYTSLEKKPFDQIDLEEWRRVFAVNVEGVWHCCRYAAVPMTKAGSGAIVNIASSSTEKGNPGLLQYVASKGAVNAMSRVLARELGEFGIRVNTVSPGFTLSDGILNDGAKRDTQKANVRDARAIHADVQPEDIAEAVAYFLRPGASMVTGQNLIVDGGMVMK